MPPLSIPSVPRAWWGVVQARLCLQADPSGCGVCVCVRRTAAGVLAVGFNDGVYGNVDLYHLQVRLRQ
jgi:hypothetical protein